MAVLSSILGLVSTLPDVYIQRIDYASSTTVYYGFAAPGFATSGAVWQIRRETLDSSGRTTAIDFAGGSSGFTHIWDNRTSLSYS